VGRYQSWGAPLEAGPDSGTRSGKSVIPVPRVGPIPERVAEAKERASVRRPGSAEAEAAIPGIHGVSRGVVTLFYWAQYPGTHSHCQPSHHHCGCTHTG
jgi:hypothetical protein